MKKNKKSTLLFIVLFSISLSIVLYKVFHMICTNDEEYYISETLRLLQGYRVIVDNWKLAEFSTLFITPFLYVYRLFVPSNEGVVLFMRLCFVVVTAFTSVLFYITFRKHGWYSAVASALITVYAPRGIRALSYTTLSIIFLIVCFCLYQYKNRILTTISGFIYACCILCSPIFVLSFLAYIISNIINIKKNKDYFKEKSIYFIIGIFVVFILWLWIVLKDSTIKEIMNSLPYCFDDRHGGPSIFAMHLINSCARFFVEYYLYIILYVVLIVLIIKKNKYSYLFSIFVLFFGIGLILLKKYQFTIGGYDLVLIPICGQGFITYYLTNEDNRDFSIFTGFILSVLLGIIYCAQSDGGIRTMCGPLILGVSLTIIMIKNFNLRSSFEITKMNHMELITPIFVIVFLFSYSFFFNLGGHSNNEYNVKFEKGPHKGLYSNIKTVTKEYSFMEELYDLEKENEGYLCYVGHPCWPYIYNNVDILSFNTYSYAAYTKEDFIERTNIFFALHKDKRPIIYYINKGNDVGIECDPSQFNGASLLKETSNGCILKIE